MSDNGNDSVDVEELKNFIHSQGSVDKAFASQDTVNVLRMMVLSDPNILDNAMRYDIPSLRMVLGLAMSIQECEDHDFQSGVEFFKLLCGLMPSRRGRRIEQLISAIAGQQAWEKREQTGGFFDKAKNWAFPPK